MVDLEFPVGEEDGSNKGPYEQTCGRPLGCNPDPDRWPPDINKLSALTNGGWPASQEHCWVHAGQGEYEVEERVGVCHWPWYILLIFLFICLAEGKQWLVGTWRLKERHKQQHKLYKTSSLAGEANLTTWRVGWWEHSRRGASTDSRVHHGKDGGCQSQCKATSWHSFWVIVKPVALVIPGLTRESTVAQIGAVETNNWCRQQATIDLKINRFNFIIRN